MKHGAGGAPCAALIEEVFLAARRSGRGGGWPRWTTAPRFRSASGWLVVTTDSHVIHPSVFPGGDIGRLAVAGTVNDLAMMGATDLLGLTCGVMVEEGFPIEELVRLQALDARRVRRSGDRHRRRRHQGHGPRRSGWPRASTPAAWA